MAGLAPERWRSAGALTKSAGSVVEVALGLMFVGPLRTFSCSVQPAPSIHSALRAATRMFPLTTVEAGHDAWQTRAWESAPSSHTVLYSNVVPLVGPKEDVLPRAISPMAWEQLGPQVDRTRL
ncbi:hypothetical protein SRABI128_05430 [Microbacterium sp. Bi128]|nr:hypothetical protein SRABI128_05430 [Microbacterium sp. Bi128]